MSRSPIPTWFFALVVVRREDRFLLVQETKHDQLWYLPAGRVEPGESLADAALRETLEEAGVPIRLTGILSVEHTPRTDSARVRIAFLAEPVDGTPPKSRADEHSLQAAWVTLSELGRHPLRSLDARRLMQRAEAGVHIAPIELLRSEGA